MGSILGIVILALDIYAIIDVFKSSLDQSKKILWTVLIILLPLIGLILYFLLGKKK